MHTKGVKVVNPHAYKGREGGEPSCIQRGVKVEYPHAYKGREGGEPSCIQRA